jgi:hypothetical protein
MKATFTPSEPETKDLSINQACENKGLYLRLDHQGIYFKYLLVTHSYTNPFTEILTTINQDGTINSILPKDLRGKTEHSRYKKVSGSLTITV